jgi:chromosome condensin MukBEF ATPase and DNA-binding subunit MukB
MAQNNKKNEEKLKAYLRKQKKKMTLNQVIKRLKTLAEAHKQVKHFAFEDAVSYLNDNSDINYPAIIVSDNPFSVSRTQKANDTKLQCLCIGFT